MTTRRTLLLAALPWPAHAAAMNFPADFGAHPRQGIEWWYLTGLLGDAAGAPPRFGYQLTFFRLPGPAPADHPSALAARQLLLGHVALSDLGAQQQRHAQRLLRALPGAAYSRVGDCDVRLRDWTLKRSGNGYQASFNGPGFALELQLSTAEPPLLQGDGGLSRKGADPAQFSHYYSRPQLDTRATLVLDGRRLPLAGRAWLDHEWSDSVLGESQGWDWLGINLDDGRALTLFQLRRKDGSRDWTGGSLRTPGQADRSFGPDEVDMRPTRHWTSPATGTRWPVEWRLKCPAGEMLLAAAFDAQEIDARRTSGLVYWEGAARLFDTQKRPLGAGYLELTGYAGRPPLI
ncbi:lipocalin-like domain-containing protein [Pelomonas aquatica]|jgi:predicted secreted hydrolase|uniref:Carotenoid 1,2-hydratase n=1 Tax=Pelomonas aquatica TaxID=431058 RepID=A0A9X4R6V3_9BURK|nr:carotenoid 1,2-hydratase [Pelomonas aquatica]MCY4753747.1 carotenoid 1,2-hydratase [Pelomonas aquatica]MDG0865230.1 carotenoid 1,2-hydratase [Pelomonas aquatica]